jgi:hypothetical protein
MAWLIPYAVVGILLWLPWKVCKSLQHGRDGRSPRLWVCFKLWLAYICLLFGAISLFASGTPWITTDSVLVATVIFLIMLCYYWCVIDVWCKVAYSIEGGRKQELFDIFIESGGDPFIDFLPQPINNDSFFLRALGKTEMER